jgi:cytochrome c oxidase subunit II
VQTRRRILLGALGLGGLGILGARALAQPAPLGLKKGVPVVFELTTTDTVMGFSIPDFKVRADIIPGKVTQLPFTPDRAGKFAFLCDVFCGSGHEDMQGTLIVE